MILKVLGSGSSGNCYILESDKECLVIEAGLPFMLVKKALNFNIKKIVGVIVTHSHGDHSQRHGEYKKAGFKVFKPYECEDLAEKPVRFGNFTIKAFSLVHDVPCYGFWIHHSAMGTMVYITDTEYCKYRFKNLNHIMVEANYCNELIDRDNPKYRHVLEGHMNIDTACRFLAKNCSSNLRNVILLHLSEDSANADMFRSIAEKVVDCPVSVARKGLELELGLPFYTEEQ